jgi:alkanesulfonate monooxygenase SsuD/methylene tetrahydromethanopterin reductase-like flavin-dependent oxidoreductase (luciferase family)
MTAIKIGTGLPVAMDARGVPSVGEAARQIEELGFESVWVSDLILGDATPALEAALILATAAAVTDRVKIGFSVLVVPLRPAPWLATQVATLQHLSKGRLLLGVGSGGFPDAPFWRALGVLGRDRGRITDTTLALLPRLLSGEPVQILAGEPPLTLAPTGPMPPVLVGGSERAFRRVLEFGDGWFPSLITPAALGHAVTRLREQAAERDLPAPTVTVGGHLIIGTDENARAAYDSLVRNLIDVHRMTPEVAAQTPMRARTPEELAEIFAAYQQAGADRIVTGADNEDWTTQLEFMAEARALLN